jgi:hypothetical protein
MYASPVRSALINPVWWFTLMNIKVMKRRFTPPDFLYGGFILLKLATIIFI